MNAIITRATTSWCSVLRHNRSHPRSLSDRAQVRIFLFSSIGCFCLRYLRCCFVVVAHEPSLPVCVSLFQLTFTLLIVLSPPSLPPLLSLCVGPSRGYVSLPASWLGPHRVYYCIGGNQAIPIAVSDVIEVHSPGGADTALQAAGMSRVATTKV